MKKVKKARPAPNFDKLHTNWQKSFQLGKACSKKICTQVQEFDLTKPGTKFTPAKATPDLSMSEDDADNLFYENEYQSLKKTMEAKQATMDSYIPSTMPTTGARRKILTDVDLQQNSNTANVPKVRTPSLVEEQQELGDIPFESDAVALTSILKDTGIVSTAACQRVPVRHTMAVGSKRVVIEATSQRHSMAQPAGCSWTCHSELYRRSIYYQPNSNQSLKEEIKSFNKCHEGSRDISTKTEQDQGRMSAKKSSKADMQFMSSQTNVWDIDSPFNHCSSVVRLRAQSRILRTPENNGVPARRVVTSTKRHGTMCPRMSSSTSKKVQKTLRWAEILREEDSENQASAGLASTLQFCDQIPGSSAVSAAAIGDSAQSPQRWMTHTIDTSPQTTAGQRPLRVECSNRAGTSTCPQRAEGQRHGGGQDRMKLQVLKNKEKELEREIGAIEMTLEAEESLQPDLPLASRVSVTGQRARLSPSSNSIAVQSRQRDRLSPSSNSADAVLKLAQKKRRSVQDLSQVLHEVGEYSSQLNNRANVLKEQDQNVDSDRIRLQIHLIQSQQKRLQELQSELEEQLLVEQRKEMGAMIATSKKFRNLNIEENNNGCARNVDMISDSQNNLTNKQESVEVVSKDGKSARQLHTQQNTEPLCDITHHQNVRTKISIVLDRSQMANNNNDARQSILDMTVVEPGLGSQVVSQSVSSAESNVDSSKKSPSPKPLDLYHMSARDPGLLIVADTDTNVALPLDLSTKKCSEISSAETHRVHSEMQSCNKQEYVSPFLRPHAKQKLEFSTTQLSPTVAHALIPQRSPNSAFSDYSRAVKADEVVAASESSVPPISTPLSKRIEAGGNVVLLLPPTDFCTYELDVQPSTQSEKDNNTQNVSETVPESLKINAKPNLKIGKSGFSSHKKRANEDRILDDILLKRALKCSAERFHEALLDDEVTLFACRLQSSHDVSSGVDRGFTNPIATTLDRGDDYHFVPI